MNRANNKKGKTQKKSTAPLKIMVKLGWNNRRISIPAEVKVDKNMTLSQVIESINDDEVKSLLASGNGSEELAVLYLRNCTRKNEWGKKLSDVIGDDSGGILLTLTKVSDSSSNTPVPSVQASAPTTTPKVIEKKAEKVDNIIDTRKTEPMDISDDLTPVCPTPSKSPATCESALQTLFSSYFTSDIRDCTLTLIKIIDNIVSKPGDDRVRSIRLNNPNIQKKIASKNGAVDFLIACGFTGQGLSVDEKLVLLPHNESVESLLSARELARNKCIKELNMTAKEFPPIPSPPNAGLQQRERQQQSSFDPYRAYNYNTQAAMHGVNATSLPSQALSSSSDTYISPTQSQLDYLTNKKKNIEKSLDAKPFDRELTAYSPASSIDVSPQQMQEMQPSGGKGDGALIAQRMKKIDEERKQRENAGFTTKAMRDLEKLKKQKLYKHSQLRIFFPDGYSLCCNFKPHETIAIVKQTISSTFVTPESMPDFDLYITPPRQVFKNLDNTLLQEQLVPAARVFVSWKKDINPKDYIQSEYFKSNTASFAVPDGEKIVADNSVAKKRNASSRKDTSTKEELLMRKMLGGSKSIGGSNNRDSKDSSDDSKKNWKPKWL